MIFIFPLSSPLLPSLSLSPALFTTSQRISPCPPPLPVCPAPPAAPRIRTSALLLWCWTLSHPAARLRPRCPSTTSRWPTRASSGSAWSVSAMETSTRAYWWGWRFCNPAFPRSVGLFLDFLLHFLKKGEAEEKHEKKVEEWGVGIAHLTPPLLHGKIKNSFSLFKNCVID